MKTKLFLSALLLSLLPFLSIGQIPTHKNKVDKNGLRQKTWTLTYDQNWVETNLPDSIRFYRIIEYKDDLPVGLTRDYYLNGQVQFEGTITQDRPEEIIEGKAVWYYEDGTVSNVATFIEGVKEGIESIYYTSGVKYADVPYAGGFVEGRVVLLNEDGSIQNIEYYVNNEKQTLQQLYDLGNKFYQEGNYSIADSVLKDVLVPFTVEFGADHENINFINTMLWRAQLETGQIEESIATVSDLRRIRELRAIRKDSVYRDWLYDIMIQFKNHELYEQLEPLLLKIVEIQKEITPIPNNYYQAYMVTLADFYRFRKRYDDSEKIYLEAIEALKMHYPNQPELYTREMASLAAIWEEQQRYSEAEALYEESLDMFRASKDTTQSRANTLGRLLSLYTTQTKNLEALPFAMELQDLQEMRYGNPSKEYTNELFRLARIYRNLNRFEEAEKMLIQSTEGFKKAFTTTSSEYANLQYHFGLLYKEWDDPRAESYFKEAVKSYEKSGNMQEDELRIKVAEVLSNLGEMYTLNGDIIRAQPTLLQAFEKIQNLDNPNIFSVAVVYEKIGTSQLTINNFDEAEDAYKEAIKVVEVLYGTNHHNYIQGVANLSLVYSKSKRGEKSLELLDAELEKIDPKSKDSEPSYIALLEAKITAYEYLEMDSLAVQIGRQTLDYYQNIFGINHPRYLTALADHCLAQISSLDPEAYQTIQKLDSLQQKYGLDSIYDQRILVLNLKQLHAVKNEDLELAVEYGKQMAVSMEEQGDLGGYISLGLNYFTNNQNPEALAAYQKYIDQVMVDVDETFPHLTEDQQVGFYNSKIKYHLDLYNFLSLAEAMGLKMSKDSAFLAEQRVRTDKIESLSHPAMADVYNYQLKTKGILFESNLRMLKAVQESNDPALVAIYKEWKSLSDKINDLIQKGQSPEVQQERKRTEDQIKIIERQMAQKSSNLSKRENDPFTWQDIKEGLKEGEAVIEMMAISAGKKLRGEKYSDMYIAFVITPDTEETPLTVILGKGDSLESKYLNVYQNSMKYKVKDLYSYNKYWKKIAKAVEGYSTLYFAPDGVYHKVNVNSLFNPESGKYLIEEKDIRFISQGRDLLTKNSNGYSEAKTLALFGAPSYNQLPGEENYQVPIEADSLQRFFSADGITELPGTRLEVEEIDQLARGQDFSVASYTGNQALEETVKHINAPSVLHIATHGYFMPEQEGDESTEDQEAGFANFSQRDLKNPMRRSGLLFSYCKHAFTKELLTESMTEDGILTAEEASKLSLNGTELVVLSACETGLGDVMNGEGVYGLQRAFQTAGAESILMSLWTVSDDATQRLMTEFYKQWFSIKDKGQAFRKAQLALKEEFEHPYYWGAFILVGQ